MEHYCGLIGISIVCLYVFGLIQDGFRYRRLRDEGRTLMCSGETEIDFRKRKNNT